MPLSFAERVLNALRSLRVAVIVATLAGVALPAIWFSLAEVDQLKEQYGQALDRDLARTTELVAMSMREPIWQFAPEQATSIIEAAMLDPRIVSVDVFDSSTRPFASKRRDNAATASVATYTARVVRQDQVVGHVEIVISTAEYQDMIDASLRRAWIRTLLGITASVLLIGFLLHVRLVIPIGRLVRASEEVAAGNLTQPINPGRRDEIGRVGEALETVREKLSNLVSELERSNEELRSTNDSLEQRVMERTRDLESALDKLMRAQNDMVESEKLASLGRVVAGIAHELNTPIGNALTVASTISDNLRPLIAEFRDGNVRRSTLAGIAESDTGVMILMRNLEKAAEMIANFKQVAVDQTSEQRRVFDLGKVTEEVLSTLRPALRKSGHQLEMDCAPGVECDSFPGPYGQVLTNLVMNAITHGLDNHTAGVVTVRAEAAGVGRARLIVIDNGIGMNEDVKRRIFDPFFTTRMGRGGTGLGMNIVQGFVTRILGGTIRIESQPGLGARFEVEFPTVAPKG